MDGAPFDEPLLPTSSFRTLARAITIVVLIQTIFLSVDLCGNLRNHWRCIRHQDTELT